MTAAGGRHDASTLRDYAGVVWRGKWILGICLILLPVTAVALSMRKQPVYQASADVLLRYQTVAATLSGIEDPAIWQDPTRLSATQIEIARTLPLAARVVKRAGVENLTPGGFLASSTVQAHDNADVISFAVRSGEPAHAVALAKAYASQFTTYRQQLATASLTRTRRDLQARIDELLTRGDRRSQTYAQTLIAKDEQLATMQTVEGSNAVVLPRAVQAQQIEPRPRRSLLLGLTLGLILGVGLAFLRETLDTRVRTAAEIGEKLGLPLLARLPAPPKRVSAKDDLVMLAEPNGVHAEAFRMLRTNLEFANLKHNARTIMVTSAVEEEGKSTTVANLAVALARGGRRVVVVDLDLRRPFLHRFFGLESEPGVTDVALGHVTLSGALAQEDASAEASPPTHTANGNGHAPANGSPSAADSPRRGVLEILTSGVIPPDAGEFVTTDELAGVFERLRAHADFVLVDAPPLLHVGDAMALAGRLDAVLMVTRLTRVSRPMLGEARRLLDTCPAAKLGFIVTDAELEPNYGYGTGYGYGYTAQHERERERV